MVTMENTPDGSNTKNVFSGSLIGKVLIILFLVPFATVGLFTGYIAVKRLLDGNWEEGGFMLVFALVFGGVGLGGMVVAIMTSRKKKRVDARKTAHAGQPWMWRDDWATGNIRSTAKTQIVFFLIFTILWNLISTPLAFFLPEEIFEKGNTAALLGFLFPLVGIGLAVGTGRMILARRKFGETRFLMSTIPGVIGGEVAGSVEVGRELTGTLLIRLSSIHSVTTGSGKNSSTNETVLWQDERSVVQGEPLPDHPGERFPVRFQIPFESSPTDDANSRNQILWRLETRSEEPGIDFSATFEVPVFKTERSSPSLTEEKVARESSGVPGVAPPEPPPRLEIRTGAEGGTEYVLPAKPNLRGSLGLGIFTLIWTGVVVLIALADAPLLFVVVFGAFDLLFIGGLVSMNFLSDTILVEAESVSVRHRVFGFLNGTRLPRRSISRVKAVNISQSGTTSYWTVAFEQTGGKGARLWQMLNERRHAEWLAHELRKAIGLKTD
jgi:hypothetical protein